jgi:hypothetical protein
MDQNNSIMTLQKWQKIYKNPDDLIVQASAKDGSDSWQKFPIGMSWQYALCDSSKIDLQISKHNKTVLCALVADTDSRRRPIKVNRRSIIETLQKNSIENKSLNWSDYFTFLPNYKFVISPEGNGIDCHRHYEALLAGCIPIMEHNPLIEEKYKGCPVLYTTDYSEINEEYLNKVYEEMLDKEYDFSRLFITFYNEDEIQNIKDCGNYWVERLTQKIWYK